MQSISGWRYETLVGMSNQQLAVIICELQNLVGERRGYQDAAFYDDILKFVNRKPNKDGDALETAARNWIKASYQDRVFYDWTWLGIPIIQTPSDMMVMQELLFRMRPKTLIETGVAHGGSLIFYSSVLDLIHGTDYLVIGVEREFRSHNRRILESHPLYQNVNVIEGDSVSPSTIGKIRALMADPPGNVIVALDSYHGKDHVLRELELYCEFVNVGSYIVVFDTVIDILDGVELTDNTVSKSNSPKVAVEEFLQKDDRFVIDETCDKLFVSHARNGFLRRIRE